MAFAGLPGDRIGTSDPPFRGIPYGICDRDADAVCRIANPGTRRPELRMPAAPIPAVHPQQVNKEHRVLP